MSPGSRATGRLPLGSRSEQLGKPCAIFHFAISISHLPRGSDSYVSGIVHGMYITIQPSTRPVLESFRDALLEAFCVELCQKAWTAFVHLSICPFVHLSTCPPVHLSLAASISHHQDILETDSPTRRQSTKPNTHPHASPNHCLSDPRHGSTLCFCDSRERAQSFRRPGVASRYAANGKPTTHFGDVPK